MTDKTVAQKAHIKPGLTLGIVNRVAGVVESLGLPADTVFVTPAKANVVLLFARTRAELEATMPPAVRQLAPNAVLMVFFRKGASGAGLDMNRDSVWAVAEGLGMRPLGLVSVDDTWSAFRLKAQA